MPSRRDDSPPPVKPSSPPPPSVPPSLPPSAPGDGADDEVLDPNETMFFQRRAARKSSHLLPFIVLVVLVCGGAGLLGWAYLRSLRPAAGDSSSTTSATSPIITDPSGGRPILTPEEARRRQDRSVAVTTPTPPSTPAPTATPEVRRALPVTPTPADNNTTATAADAAGGGTPNLDLGDAENAQVKKEVLARVDLMPEVSQDNKDKLYAAVDRARGMGRVMTLPFDKGRVVVNEADIEKLRRRAAAPEVKRFTDDPTVVFVVLGYADQKGDAKANYELSLRRARSTLDALRDRCGFQNVMHAVGMGGSTMFSQQQADKNRVAEVWAVLP